MRQIQRPFPDPAAGSRREWMLLVGPREVLSLDVVKPRRGASTLQRGVFLSRPRAQGLPGPRPYISAARSARDMASPRTVAPRLVAHVASLPRAGGDQDHDAGHGRSGNGRHRAADAGHHAGGQKKLERLSGAWRHAVKGAHAGAVKYPTCCGARRITKPAVRARTAASGPPRGAVPDQRPATAVPCLEACDVPDGAANPLNPEPSQRGTPSVRNQKRPPRP